MLKPCAMCKELCTPWMWFASVQGHVCQDCANKLRDKEIQEQDESATYIFESNDICS